MSLSTKPGSLLGTGDYLGVLDASDEIIALDGNYTDALTNKGLVLNNLGTPEEIIVWYDKGVDGGWK